MKKTSKVKIFFNLFGIFALLISVSHVVHFVNPLLRISQPAELPTDGNDLTTLEFLELVQFFQEYDWTTYDSSDFPDWLYMPETYPAELNQTENEMIPPFYGYGWTTYDPSDFPNWLDMPATLPADFQANNATYVQEFIFSHIDEDFKEELENSFNAEESAITMIISPFIFIYELIFALVFFAVAIIALIVSRSFE